MIAELLTHPTFISVPIPAREPAGVLECAAALADRLATMATRADEREESAFPEQELAALAEAGFLTAAVSREHGGCGIGIERGSTLLLLRLLKHIGRGNLAVGRIYEGHINALQLIALFGSAEQVARASTDARERQLRFGVWNAEAQNPVRLVPLGRGWFRMEGVKDFCSGAGFVERPIVTGALPGGEVQMCLLPMERLTQSARIDPTWWRPLGMKATASFQTDFTGIEVGPDELIGGPGDYYRDPWFRAGAVRFAAVQLGAAEAISDIVRGSLRAFGRAGDPWQQARAAEMATLVESGNLWLRGAAENWERPSSESERAVAYAGMVRGAVETICTRVMQLAERSVGARGLMQPSPLERLIRDLTMYLRQPAPDAVAAHLGRFVLENEQPAHQQWEVADADENL